MVSRKTQISVDTVISWTIGTIFWLASSVWSIALGRRLWITMNAVVGSVPSISVKWVAVFERFMVVIVGLFIASLIVYLFFKFIEPDDKPALIWMDEGNEYFNHPWHERIKLLKKIKLFLIVGAVGVGVWIVTWFGLLLTVSLGI
ncbi:MAG: hypothetical protein JW750_03460 [Anaerolineaceae bacterium]|nr:hypothetical protein [Anaerolineaceae bacterium]